eukprot:TRINITY_DN3225_c0_g1_i3.p1 TRINITY_DN3225_c0_g1~~TRINITY_DN3225_c0_g1_i3.p1  ORF type:complete len:182 (-),score=32.94 TRINITY_DN3225_c0_g1_i3:257-802(-)
MSDVCQGTVIGDVHKAQPPQVYQNAQQNYAFQGHPSSPVQGAAIQAPVQNQWSYELLGCFQDSGSCLESFFCEVCQVSRQYNALHNNTNEINWAAMGGSVLIDASAYAPLSHCFLLWHVRHNLRQKYNIAGSPMGDATVALCCGPCAVAQQYRELAHRGEWSGACCATAPRPLPVEMGQVE